MHPAVRCFYNWFCHGCCVDSYEEFCYHDYMITLEENGVFKYQVEIRGFGAEGKYDIK